MTRLASSSSHPTDGIAVLQTPRLVLRPWTEDDAVALHAVFGDAEAMRFWNTAPSARPEDLLPGIRRSVSAPAEYHAAWAVVLRASGVAIGFVNYHHREVSSARLEIGYILARAFWGQGLAREAVAALLDHCFGAMAVNRVEALIDPDNTASLRLAERLGFRCESGRMRQRLKMPDGRFADILMYGLLAADWAGRPTNDGTAGVLS
jgi:ribosomal-protein-alanine N-acetyltransferase